MSHNDTASRLREFRARLNERLREQGFTLQRNTWRRMRTPFIDVIELQPSKWNTSDTADVTVNVGIIHPDIYEAITGRRVPAHVKESESLLRTRLGALMEGGRWGPQNASGNQRDRWWTIDRSTNIEILASEVAHAVLVYAIPFLERFDSLEFLQQFYEQHGGGGYSVPYEQIYLAAIKVLLGDLETADGLLASAARTLGDSEQVSEARKRIMKLQGKSTGI